LDLCILLSGELGYTIHAKWFQISRHEYDLLNYYGMAFIKGCNFLFFLFSCIAIRMVLKRKSELWVQWRTSLQ
jgi:hypothetical protein